MRYTLLILFIFQLSFSQTIDKSNLLKEIDETHDNGKPKKVDYKNFDLEVVLTETYDESGDITSSYQLNPETGKRNGEFFNFPLNNLYPEGFKNYNGSFDFENPKNVGEYDEGVLIKCDNCTFYMYGESGEYYNSDYSSSKLIYTGDVYGGRLIGNVSVYKLYESTTTVKNEHGSRIFSQDLGRPVTLYMETGSGMWSKQFYYSFSFDKNGLVDDGEIKFYRNFDENSLSKIVYKNNVVSEIINYKGTQTEPKDSIVRSNKLWKIDNKFVKNKGWYLGPRFDPLDIDRFVSSIDNFSEYTDYEKFEDGYIFYNSDCESNSRYSEYDYCYKSSIGNLVFFGSENSQIEDSDIDGYFRYYPNGRFYSDYGDGGQDIYSFFDLIKYDNLDSNGIYTYYNNGHDSSLIKQFLSKKFFKEFLENFSLNDIFKKNGVYTNKIDVQYDLDQINSFNTSENEILNFIRVYSVYKQKDEIVLENISTFNENLITIKESLTQQLNSFPDFNNEKYFKLKYQIKTIYDKLMDDFMNLLFKQQDENFEISFKWSKDLIKKFFQNNSDCDLNNFEYIVGFIKNYPNVFSDTDKFFNYQLKWENIRLENNEIFFGKNSSCDYSLEEINVKIDCLINYVELIRRYSIIDKSEKSKKFNRFLNKTFDVDSWSSSLKQNGIDLDNLVKEDVCKLNDEMKFLEKQIDLFIEKNK